MALIPADTKIPAFRVPMVKEAIEGRKKRLAKLRFGQAELSLWLMDEIAHLTKLFEFNKPLLVCPCQVKLNT